jgi:hypothetical protein
MKSGIAGSTMVSADTDTIPNPLKIASVIHGEEVVYVGFCIFIFL